MATQVDKAKRLPGAGKRARRIPDDEYEMYRSKILAMYLEQGKSREEVRRILDVEHEFSISLKQLKHRLYKWSARKNSNQSKAAETPMSTGPRQGASTTRRPRCSVLKTELDLRGSEGSPSPNLSRRLPTEPRQGTLCGRARPARYQKHTNSREHSPGVGCGDPLPPQNANQPASPTRYACARETAPVVQHLELEDGLSRTTYSEDTSFVLSSQSFVISPHRPPGDVSRILEPDLSRLDVLQTFNDPDHGYHQTVISSVGPALVELGHHRSPSSALAATTSTHFVTPGQEPSSRGASSDVFLDSPSFASPEEPPPQSNEEDPTIITEVLLTLRSIYSRFLDCGYMWQSPSGYTLHDPSYLEVFEAFISPWVRIALETILSHYLLSSISWLRLTKPPYSSTSNTVPYLESAPKSLDVANSSHKRQSIPPSEQPVLLAEGHLVVLNLLARENPNADMIKLQLRRWSERSQSTLPADAGLSMTMSYIPRAFGRKTGISLTLTAPTLEQLQARPQPTLRTFGVIPSNSAIIQCIHRNDINGIRELFSLGRATPSDVDSEGCSLISHAVQYRRLEIFRLLLDAGAYCEDVANGLDIVAVIWGYYLLRDPDKDLLEETKECMGMTRLSQGKGNDLEESLHNIVAGISVLNKSKRAERSTAAPVIQYAVNLFEVDALGPSGRTPLLCACTINNTMTLEVLISRGANVRARDRFGRGALHSALYTRSYIACPESCGMSKQEVRHQCSCPAEPNLHDCHYIRAWRECPRNNRSDLEDTLRILLQHGCDPNLLDGYNCSPSDYVQQRPDLQTIWFGALAIAGYNWDGDLLKWLRPGTMGQFDWEPGVTGWSGCYTELSAF